MRGSVWLVAGVVLLGSMAVAQIHGKDGITLPNPPAVKTDPATEEYASADSSAPVKITDPYRWLEDAQSPETRAFIATQNTYTQQYFSQVKMMPEVAAEMTKLLRVDVIGIPTVRGKHYFFSRRLAEENQAS